MNKVIYEGNSTNNTYIGTSNFNRIITKLFPNHEKLPVEISPTNSIGDFSQFLLLDHGVVAQYTRTLFNELNCKIKLFGNEKISDIEKIITEEIKKIKIKS